MTAAFLLFGCSVTSEKFRYQSRFDRFYFLLNNDEKGYFASGDLDKLSASIKPRLESDKALNKHWDDVQYYEAISGFNPAQTAHFFREVILKELDRDYYYKFMGMLDAGRQKEFALTNGFMDSYLRLYKQNPSFKSIVDSIKKDGRLYGFSDSQVYGFLRHTIFPESCQKYSFFSLLKLLKECGALADFKAGNIALAAQKLGLFVQNSQEHAAQLQNISSKSGLSALPVPDLLLVYNSVVLKEMDPYALSHTLAKF